MRVIAGKCRSLPLKTLPGRNTRPTADRIRETLFNILMPELPGCRFLDLFAGSGAIGIEALSRGALFCTFVEKSRAAARIIQENLHFTHLDGASEVCIRDVRSALSLFPPEPVYDLVFMDPPYQEKQEEKVLPLLLHTPCISKEALIVVEAALETDFSYLSAIGYDCIREKVYKTNKHLFLKRKTS